MGGEGGKRRTAGNVGGGNHVLNHWGMKPCYFGTSRPCAPRERRDEEKRKQEERREKMRGKVSGRRAEERGVGKMRGDWRRGEGSEVRGGTGTFTFI